MKVIIDPRCNMFYTSYYIKGIWDKIGKKNVSFSMKYFKDLKVNKAPHDSFFAFVVRSDENKLYKIVIDFGDKTQIIQEAYQWCDEYAKINYNKDEIFEEYLNKITIIPPGFGIKIWGLGKTVYYAFSNLIKAVRYSSVNIYIFLYCYGMSYKRSEIDHYTKEVKSQNNYIFFVSTLWNLRNCIETTNKLRYKFILNAKAMKNVIFEGGLWTTEKDSEYEKYKAVVYTKRYKSEEYVNKTKRSCLVFNTPAVHNCHGWKLGEFLAMGKAIVSTPLANSLPEALIHGYNVHFVKNDEEINDALQLILNDDSYRSKLESNSKNYYTRLASPTAVISNILDKLR